jgi:hypothetical protein
MNKNYEIFSEYIPNLKIEPNQQNVKCIFHEEKEASLSINLDKGLFHCHGCKTGGDIYSFVMKKDHLSFREAKLKILGDARLSVLSEGEVLEAHEFLMSKPYLHDLLFKHRGWMPETFVRFKLGWNDREKRVQIPIYNEHGSLINIRKYLVVGNPTKKNPKFLGVRGHNDNYFFPIKNLLKEEFIMLCAGEPDTILACQLGKNAGTFTSGEGSFNRNLLPMFQDKLVYLCYDTDLQGVRGERMIIPELVKYAKAVKKIALPF